MYFVNEAFDKELKKYMESPRDNSFLNLVIKMLGLIYSELDIINPYLHGNLSVYIDNLNKFGYPREKIDIFNDSIQIYYNDEKQKKNVDNNKINIIRELISMVGYKKNSYNISKIEEIEFKNILTKMCDNSSINKEHIIDYFTKTINNINKSSTDNVKKLLIPEAYKVIDKNYTDVALLTAEDIELINEEVYNKLEVNKNAVNFEYLLDKALINYFDKKDVITSGNGYVDILLIMCIIATIIMLIVIALVIFM